ncbi:MAG: WYL domain-containing protein [Clostridiales bacterium]|nr:WYL domain-containing protein [Clostridiales bacterium]
MSEKAYGKLKILNLMDILLHQTDFENPMTAVQLCDELQKRGIKAERKSVYSDISALNEFGFDIRKRRSDVSGFYCKGSFLKNGQIQLISDFLMSADFLDEKASFEILSKLFAFSKKSFFEGEQEYRNNFKTENEEVLKNIENIIKAIEERKQVDFIYDKGLVISEQKLETIEEKRTVTPVKTKMLKSGYFLVGKDEDNQIACWRIDKMRLLKISGKKALDFDSEEIEKHFINNRFVSDLSQEVELICKNSCVERVLDLFGSDIVIRKYDEDSFLIKEKVNFDEELISFIFCNSESIRVKSPERFKKELLERSALLTNNYKDSPM